MNKNYIVMFISLFAAIHMYAAEPEETNIKPQTEDPTKPNYQRPNPIDSTAQILEANQKNIVLHFVDWIKSLFDSETKSNASGVVNNGAQNQLLGNNLAPLIKSFEGYSSKTRLTILNEALADAKETYSLTDDQIKNMLQLLNAHFPETEQLIYENGQIAYHDPSKNDNTPQPKEVISLNNDQSSKTLAAGDATDEDAADEDAANESEFTVKPAVTSKTAEKIKEQMIKNSIKINNYFSMGDLLKMRELLEEQKIFSIDEAINIFNLLINDREFINKVSTNTINPDNQDNLAHFFMAAYNLNNSGNELIVWDDENKKFIPSLNQ